MRFGAWQPIETAATAAPEAPGVLQARADALLAYPRGKSAMVLYGRSPAGETLRRYVAGDGAASLARATEAGARWVRYGDARDPDAELARLLSGFTERFGAPPCANRTD